jgi:D-alanine-D-alanine ligase
MNKKRVIVLMGGNSPEYEISILSGQQIVANIDSKKYEVFPLVISKDGKKWMLTSKKEILKIENPIKQKGTQKDVSIVVKKSDNSPSSITFKKADVVFVAMHGPFGEDGVVQAILETTGIPYTGSGVLASALGMDKEMFRKVMKACSIPVPKYVVANKNTPLRLIYKTLGKLPYFVKPVDQGSSVGSSVVKYKKDLPHALKLALKYSPRVLIDEYIKGLELTCGVLGNEKPVALPVTEIHPLKGNFFDYESKYKEFGAEEITPAGIGRPLTKKIQEMAIAVYKAIGCRGFGRVDFILNKDQVPVVLEINTIPGLTPMSLLPKAANAAGIEYPELIDKIIKSALN